MQDLLHSEIDSAEEYRAKAAAVVDAIRARAKEIASQHGSFEETLTAIAAEVEEGLADLTTQAARTGLGFGKRRAGLGKKAAP